MSPIAATLRQTTGPSLQPHLFPLTATGVSYLEYYRNFCLPAFWGGNSGTLGLWDASC